MGGGVVVVLVVVGAVVWLTGGRDAQDGAVAVSATVDGEPVDLVSSPPTSEQAAALADLGAPGYLALHPFAAVDPSQEGELAFALALPEELPAGAIATFARFDGETGAWEPVATTIAEDAVTVTARTLPTTAPAADGDGLGIRTASSSTAAGAGVISELWTVVIGGADSAMASLGEAFDRVGAQIGEVGDAVDGWWQQASAGWSADLTLGSQWVMRAAREILGTGADAPECAPDTDGAVPWIAETVMSDNAMIAGLGIEGGNAAVLLCAGPDPADPSKLQVRAAANRSYGFPVVFPDGMQPSVAGMDALDVSTSELIEAGYAAIASGGDLLLNPGRFILPSQTYSFSVDEDTVRASQERTASGRVVEYALPTFPQVLLSGVLGAALAELDPEDFFGGALGVFLLARDCDFTQWQAGTAWTELVDGVSVCAQALDSDAVQNAATDVARTASGESADRAAEFVGGGAEKARRILGTLRWMTLFSLTQSAIDYVGDVGTEEVSDMPAWFVNATLAAAPSARWEDVAGTWCAVSVAFCTDIAPGTTQTEFGTSTLTFETMMGDCFAGIEVYDPGSGVNVVYCPAGAATPAEVPGSEPGLPPRDDDVEFDRVFVYQGYGTAAWFRQDELAAVRG